MVVLTGHAVSGQLTADVLGDYAPEIPSSDLFSGSSGHVTDKWHLFADGLADLCGGDWAQMHEQVQQIGRASCRERVS
jgi:hypothetical protein